MFLWHVKVVLFLCCVIGGFRVFNIYISLIKRLELISSLIKKYPLGI
jgi:hypothetical protein